MNQQLVFTEVRSLGNGRILEGRALSFEILSKVIYDEDENLYYTETLKRGCLTQELIDQSDVVANYNHVNNDIVGRSKNGNGTLKLDLRDDGLYVQVDCPHTRFADELLELVQRGDINSMSFAYTVLPEDIEWSFNDGIYHRDIKKINSLHDVSFVVNPAYPKTWCQARSLELRSYTDSIVNEQLIDNEPKEEPKEDTKPEDENTVTDTVVEKNEEKTDISESVEINNNKEDVPVEEVPQQKENKTQRNITMDKMNISLVGQIKRSLENGEKKFNLSLETRSEETPVDVTMTHNEKVENDPYATEGKTALAEYQSLIDPLYNQQVIKNLGIKTYTGVPYGKMVFPIMSKGTVGWAKEIQKAVQTGYTTTNVELAPKRIAAYVDISKEMLLTDTLGINQAIRADLFNALADAIQNSLLDNVVGTKENNRPSGLLSTDYVKAEDIKTITSFKDLCDLEAGLEDANFNNVQYLVSNKAYAALRNLPKSAKTTELVLQNGTIDGVSVTKTGALAGKTIVLGDFSQIALAVWQNAEVVVDDISHAVEGFIRLSINMYVDFTVIKPEAFAVATIA